ncbi:MAG: DNA gyrase/topoisomerase IV subunit A [Caldithrix sp.]|nr:DNA gyrase/topoisomerase IV subunit A [Caldithrix sp.]
MDDTLKNNNIPAENIQSNGSGNGSIQQTTHVKGMYENWFLDYASYVILERAVPALMDGLKPVQRRILHAMKQMDDGRFNKVANIIGHTMQYHPHGDAAIGDAIVNMGQKDLMIETQGNWGDIRTGDQAAAPRYIEARLSKFALEVAFNAKTTEWQLSYDGRKKEPVHLPIKFPLVLAHGTEGIAVGLATKIMPHNFIELCDASIAVLQKKPINILPDFSTGGLADFSNYRQGQKGSRIRLRVKIDIVDKKTLIIRNVPYFVTTSGLIDSIIKANDNGKIKIKRVTDNTARDVEIVIDLPNGVSPQVTIDALYAFTDCEISIAPNTCVIVDEKPQFMTVDDILRRSTDNTVRLLKWELELRLAELSEKLFFASLEKIFIENRIYRHIEECETWEAILQTIDQGLEPFKKQLLREITEEDIIRLTEIKIKRISRYDSFKADELMRNLQEEIDQVQYNLQHLTDFAIRYFKRLKEQFGKGRERRTEIRSFDTIESSQVAVANEKLYINRKEGFIGYGMKKDEFVQECSDIDDIIVFLRDGKFLVTRISSKAFVGKNIIYAAVWTKNDERMIYNMMYVDGDSGKTYAKRFAVTSITRDKTYDLTKGNKNSRVLYFTANPNSESEVVTVYLNPASRARKKVFDFDFGSLDIKGRGSMGNTVTKYAVKKITQKEIGRATLGGLELWFDDTTGRLNTEGRGQQLGTFDGDQLILSIYKDGSYMLTDYDLNNRYDTTKLVLIEKFDGSRIVSAVYYDGQKKNFFVKRFQIETLTLNKPFKFITDTKDSALIVATTDDQPWIEVEYLKGRAKEKHTERLDLTQRVDVKGWKARGNRLSPYRVTYAGLIDNHSDSTGSEQNRSPDENKQSEPDEPAPEKSNSTRQSHLFNDPKKS